LREKKLDIISRKRLPLLGFYSSSHQLAGVCESNDDNGDSLGDNGD
jgi:hypothetical protein